MDERPTPVQSSRGRSSEYKTTNVEGSLQRRKRRTQCQRSKTRPVQSSFDRNRSQGQYTSTEWARSQDPDQHTVRGRQASPGNAVRDVPGDEGNDRGPGVGGWALGHTCTQSRMVRGERGLQKMHRAPDSWRNENQEEGDKSKSQHTDAGPVQSSNC